MSSHPNNERHTKRESELLGEARELLFDSLSQIEERFVYDVPFFYYKAKPLCYISVIKKEPVIGLVNGAALEDPFQILSGNQKQVRHIKLEGLIETSKEAIKFMLREAAGYIDKILEKNTTHI